MSEQFKELIHNKLFYERALILSAYNPEVCLSAFFCYKEEIEDEAFFLVPNYDEQKILQAKYQTEKEIVLVPIFNDYVQDIYDFFAFDKYNDRPIAWAFSIFPALCLN